MQHDWFMYHLLKGQLIKIVWTSPLKTLLNIVDRGLIEKLLNLHVCVTSTYFIYHNVWQMDQ